MELSFDLFEVDDFGDVDGEYAYEQTPARKLTLDIYPNLGEDEKTFITKMLTYLG